MKIEDFKSCCKARKVLHDEWIKHFDELIKEQENYLDECYKPKWRWFRKSCPTCGLQLKKKVIVKQYYSWDESSEDVIYSCNCGYEYAETV